MLLLVSLFTSVSIELSKQNKTVTLRETDLVEFHFNPLPLLSPQPHSSRLQKKIKFKIDVLQSLSDLRESSALYMYIYHNSFEHLSSHIIETIQTCSLKNIIIFIFIKFSTFLFF